MSIKKIVSLVLLVFSIAVGYKSLNIFALTSISEIKGKDKYETSEKIAIKISETINYQNAILVNADNYIADGLSSSSLSGILEAPIFLVSKYSVSETILDKLKNLQKVYIIGLEEAISKAVENKVKYINSNVQRIGGKDRIETSLAVNNELSKYKSTNSVAFVNGYKGLVDAISIAGVSAKDGMPVILTDGKSTNYNTSDKTVYIVGGEDVMNVNIKNASSVVSFKGKDRYETNKMILQKFYSGNKDFFIADGNEFSEGLASTLLLKEQGLMLVGKGSDKQMLSDSDSITAIGNISNDIILECINAVSKSNGNTSSGVFNYNDKNQNEEFNQYKQDILNLVNEERANVGLNPLQLSDELSIVANLKSIDMIEKNYFAHKSPTYGTPYQLMELCGIEYIFAGENIAYGQTSPQRVMTAWMNSEGHKANIVNKKYTQIGIGIAQASSGRIYWTQMFIGK
ncbi:MAG: cell wall-binding repeat-containing protein [Clostridioides sp.]|nr:cell wall-binding repeat-containing protein [Clostridioides sp.]